MIEILYKMIIDAVKPTFNIPDAENYFEFSVNNGETYTSTSIIEINYYDRTKMTSDFSLSNPLRLLFRETNHNEEISDYRIKKILVNNSSIFCESPNTGLNVIMTGEQQAENPARFGGKYAIYDSVTTGGLNFEDFKIEPIQTPNGVTSEMQMVFFVESNNGLSVVLRTYGIEENGTVLNICFNDNSTAMFETIKPNSNLTFITKANISFPKNVTVNNYSFEYSVTKKDVIGNPQLPENPTQTGEHEWNINIQEVIWTVDPSIDIEPVSLIVEGKQSTDEYTITINNLAKYKLIDNKWTWTGESISGEYIVYEYSAEYASTGEILTLWRVKDYHDGPASMYGFSKVDGATPYFRNYYVNYHI